MDRSRVLSALLWGAVGFSAFLTLVQGYALVVEPLVSITQGVFVATCVGAVTAVGAYALEHRLLAWMAGRVSDDPQSHDGDSKSKS
ncbi:hypothetical protein [Natronorubrum daqingense]|uniref:DUF7981 domain-containing protein n=1 Tax=Natronorubrum daqingense TaxID=588898 RepID=A0A1P8RHX5_9EURY|nr:hypothetical protein [Natronorubrum daqingense]APX98210.1 hypothetical protein BB347_10060 [Natronorubrum daqingense]